METKTYYYFITCELSTGSNLVFILCCKYWCWYYCVLYVLCQKLHCEEKRRRWMANEMGGESWGSFNYRYPGEKMTQWPLPKKLRHKNILALLIYSGCISLIKLVSDATKYFIYRQGGRLVIFALGSVQAGVVYTRVLHWSFLTSSHFVWSLPKLSGMRKECVCTTVQPVMICTHQWKKPDDLRNA